MEYVSPGDAFSSSLEHSLLIRAQQQRQALEDQLASKREDRLMQAELDSAQEQRDRIREHDEELKQKAHDKTVAEVEKRRSKMVPGDIPDPEQVALEDKLGTGPQMFPKPAESMPGIAAVPTGAVRLGMPGPTDASVRPYIGDAEQRQDAAVTADQQKYISGLPDGPQRQALESAAAMHVKPTADMLKAPEPTDQDVASIDPRTGSIRVLGKAPKGSHFVTEPAPPQVNPFAEDNHNLRVDAARDRAHQLATVELNKVSTPFEAKMAELDSVDAVLNERTTAGDAHVAPMILKALVAGQGSGFRMTKAEIDQVQNARTKWQSMEAAFNKWSADPKKALFFDETQRADFQRLVDMMRKATARHLEPIGRARHDIDAAEKPRDIQKRLSDLHDERSKGSKDEDTDAGPQQPKLSGRDYLNKYRGKKP